MRMTTMKTKTNVNAGGWFNHNETLAGGLRVKTAVKAGDPPVPLALTVNHNETLCVGWLVREFNVGVEIEPTELGSSAASSRVQKGLLADQIPQPLTLRV